MIEKEKRKKGIQKTTIVLRFQGAKLKVTIWNITICHDHSMGLLILLENMMKATLSV
jgi:hypothetical protein